MNREQILDEAKKCVCEDRDREYGNPEDNFSLIAELWNPYVRKKCVSQGADVNITSEDVAVMMAQLKIARIATGHGKRDNWVDLAGYAACGGELNDRNESCDKR